MALFALQNCSVVRASRSLGRAPRSARRCAIPVRTVAMATEGGEGGNVFSDARFGALDWGPGSLPGS